jgi:ADP-L-glycero-D-manno-heptose 6-epimerase
MILVTGSEGFIGRNLVGNLINQNKEVLEFDTENHKLNDVFETVDFSKLKLIYHLGAISNTLEKNLQALLDHNVTFSIRLFEHAIRYKVPIVFTSSASIYGNTMKDSERKINPLNYYATTKLMTEMWMQNNRKDFEHFCILRLFNVYGNNEKKTNMTTSPVWKFQQQAKNEGVITVFKDSENMIRDFVSIRDVLKALLWAGEDYSWNLNEVGTAKPISFLKVAQLVADKYDVPIKFVDMPEHMKSSYQYYTEAAKPFSEKMMTVDQWLREG